MASGSSAAGYNYAVVCSSQAQIMGMLRKMKGSILAILFLVLALSVPLSNGSKDQNCGLKLNFYNYTCPRAEKIVREMTWGMIQRFPSVGPKFLKQHFVDCFVRGCDGSILLTQFQDEVPERADNANRFGLAWSEVEDIKQRLEQECPGVVSCADIVALSARDAVSFQFERPLYPVYTGRRDGFFSRLSEVPCNRSHPYSNFSTLKIFFENKGLDVTDLVALSGAHTFGVAHCQFYDQRLYNFTGKGDQDPSLDPDYAEFLKNTCPPLSRRPPFLPPVSLDPITPDDFDTGYYYALLQNRSLLQTDAALMSDPEASSIVRKLRKPKKFLKQFAKSMMKMGAIEVLTGDEGEVRRTTCIFTNAQAEAIKASTPKPSPAGDPVVQGPGPASFGDHDPPRTFLPPSPSPEILDFSPPSPDIFVLSPSPASEGPVVGNEETAPPPMPSRCPGF